MRGMKQLFCFSRYFWVSGSGWKRKSHHKVPQLSLNLHNRMPASTLLWLSVRFKIGLNKVGLTDCSDLPSFRQFISEFLNNIRVSIDGRVMSIELRAELSFLALFVEASSKMKCGKTELCFIKEFLFSTTKQLNISLAFKTFRALKIYQ